MKIEFTEQEIQILEKSISYHTPIEQELKFVEESSELNKLFAKNALNLLNKSAKRSTQTTLIKDRNVEIRDEIADVLIVLIQLAQMYGMKQVKTIISKKIARLDVRMKGKSNSEKIKNKLLAK